LFKQAKPAFDFPDIITHGVQPRLDPAERA
jgi:hypothetical protein